LGPDAGPKKLDPDEGPIILGLAGLQNPRDLGLRSTHTQAPSVRRSFPAPSFLGLEVGLEGDA